MKYDVTYSCGHTGVVVLFGPTRDREWKLRRETEKLCAECYQKKREEDRQREIRETAEANKAAGLPPLTGTEKQIIWAEAIRKEAIKFIETKIIPIMNEKFEARAPGMKEKTLKAYESFKTRSDAAWWIDNRGKFDYGPLEELIETEIKQIEQAEAEPPAVIIDEAKVAATVYPEEQKHNLVAEITVTETGIEAIYPEKNEAFYQIVKALGMEWENRRWVRECYFKTGPAVDRAAELGNSLLRAGFPVQIMNPEARQKAIDGTFEPEQRKWILSLIDGEYKGWLAISWPREGTNYYTAARRLEGSRYAKPYVVVPAANYENVLGFAEVHGFSISPGAQKIIDAARAAKESALVTGAKPPVVKSAKKEEPVQEGILDELRDDD